MSERVMKRLGIFPGSFLAILVFMASCLKETTDDQEQGVPIVRDSLFCNVREYTKGNITFSSRPIKRGCNYSYLIVGTPNNPYAGSPAVLVRLPDGDVVNLAETPIRVLRTKASSASDVGGKFCHDIAAGNQVDSNTRWPENTIRLQSEYWLFFVKNERILAFSATQWGWWNEGGKVPAIGNPEDGKLFEFPLTQEQVIKVLGYPDKIREYLQE